MSSQWRGSERKQRLNCVTTVTPAFQSHSLQRKVLAEELVHCVCLCARSDTHRKTEAKGQRSQLFYLTKKAVCQVKEIFHFAKSFTVSMTTNHPTGWLTIHSVKKEHQLNSIEDIHQGAGGPSGSFEFFSLVPVSVALHKSKTAFHLMLSWD